LSKNKLRRIHQLKNCCCSFVTNFPFKAIFYNTNYNMPYYFACLLRYLEICIEFAASAANFKILAILKKVCRRLWKKRDGGDFVCVSRNGTRESFCATLGRAIFSDNSRSWLPKPCYQKSLARRDEISATDRIHTGAFAQERRFYFIFRLSRPFRRLLRECISYARSAAM